MKKKFDVSGMMCAACQANVTRIVAKLNGVSSVNVSLLATNMVVEYDENVVSEQAIMDAVTGIGYGCSIFVNESIRKLQAKREAALKKQRNKLILSVILLLCLMVFSMGPMIFGFPKMDDPNYALLMFIDVTMQFAFLIPIVVLNWHHYSSGYKGKNGISCFT